MTYRALSRRSFIAATTTGSLAAILARQAALAQGSCPLHIGDTRQSPPVEPVEIPVFDVPKGAARLKVGTVRHLTFAPIYLAYEKGYYAEQGLDVEVSATNDGSDIALLTATNQLQLGLNGVGPAFWNGIDTGLPLTIVAPGHEEGNPVASPLMIARKACDEGTITEVADLKGKRVSVHAPGAIEYWLDAALRTGGLTIEDVSLQYLAFPDAVMALDAGALDGAIIGEPLATQAEQQGTLVRLASDFPVQGMQVTAVYANADWLGDNPDVAARFVAGYLRACRDLMEAPNDPLNLTIINKYTDVPLQLIADSVRPVYQVNGEINTGSFVTLQEFLGARDLLDSPDPIDPATVIEQQVVADALDLIGNI
ncbi:MAG TPA: ABC transporter substrate-binding protein [Thermomicrobiales bacterium]|nr:ABC transporter substrate-binding protein [Thermomicrobiales bacterium]